MFPTWPAKSEMMKRPKKKEYEHSPQAPQGGAMFAKLVSGTNGKKLMCNCVRVECVGKT